MTQKNFFFALFAVVLFLSVEAVSLQAQVAPAALRSPVTLTAGAFVSGFESNYSPYKLGGVGAYVDLNVFHGFGVEAEGRWQRFNEFQCVSQDNYLIGPRYQIRHIWRARPYVKALGGFSNMNFENNIATGRFTTFAFGGGLDFRVTRRISIRAIDAEYQYWPKFLDSDLRPYGISAGVGYRIF